MASPATSSQSRYGLASISTSVPLSADEPTPIDLLLSTPPVVLKLLTLASPMIESSLSLVQLVTWTHPSFFSSLLLVPSWWIICLYGRLLLTYFVPALLLLYILGQYPASRGPPTRHYTRPLTLTPASYSHLLQSSQILATYVQDLRLNVFHPLHAQMSFNPLQAGKAAPAYHTAWKIMTLYPAYLILTYFVPMKVIFLMAGSVGLLWNAPFFRNSRKLLWRSAFVRWSVRIMLSIVTGGRGLWEEWDKMKNGVGIAGLLSRKKNVSSATSLADFRPIKARSSSTASLSVNGAILEEETGAVEDEGEDVRLQFTVFENQRWWVGLDWTHALLPGERASWTDPVHNPSSPPSSFTLPVPTVVYTPKATKSDPKARLKTTTQWKWLDPEWAVQPSSIPALSTNPLSPTTITPSSSYSSLPTASSPTSSLLLPASTEALSQLSTVPTDILFLDWSVDHEGWQYGDNHFDKMGPKGGLGKYTRRRAWVRRAGLVESGEIVGREKEKDKEKELGDEATSSKAKEGTSIPPSTINPATLLVPGATSLLKRVGSLKSKRVGEGSPSGGSREGSRSESPGSDLLSTTRRRKSSAASLGATAGSGLKEVVS